MDAISGDQSNKIIPSTEGAWDLAKQGMKMSLGMGVSGLLGNYIGRVVKSPIPFVSTRTLVSGSVTIGSYAGYHFVKNPTAKDILKNAAAGSAAYTFGSLIYDVLAATKVKAPGIVYVAVTSATGATPMSVEKSVNAQPGEQPIDVTPDV